MNPSWKVPQHSIEFCQPKRTRHALLIPVLNEGDRIRRQVQALQKYSAQIDIFIVDGGSSDGALESAFLKDHGVCGLLTLREPGGLSSQLRIGLANLLDRGYEGIVLVDGNGKDGLDAISRFIESLSAGYDHVQGSRFVPGGRAIHNPWKRLAGIRYVHAPLISLAAGFRYTDTTNGFRAYSRALLLDPRVQPFRDCFSRYELHYYLAIRAARLGLRVTEIPVERTYPASGKVPTKIRGLLAACAGFFNPPESGSGK
jgi:dolichol-phosphate mannosyltransferase